MHKYPCAIKIIFVIKRDEKIKPHAVTNNFQENLFYLRARK